MITIKKLIIIPAYNEEKNILKTIQSIKTVASDYDYIVINDGSTDHTQKICEENHIKVINLIENLGIGGAVQTGYKYALQNDYDIAVQFDGDGQHNPEYLNKLTDKIAEGCNIVIGSRFIDKEGFQSTALRRIGIVYLSSLIGLLTKKKITDCTSGFRACDKKLIAFFAKNYPIDYPEPETIIIALKKGFKVTEISCVMNEREGGQSSINGLKSIYYMVKVSMAILISFLNTK